MYTHPKNLDRVSTYVIAALLFVVGLQAWLLYNLQDTNSRLFESIINTAEQVRQLRAQNIQLATDTTEQDKLIVLQRYEISDAHSQLMQLRLQKSDLVKQISDMQLRINQLLRIAYPYSYDHLTEKYDGQAKTTRPQRRASQALTLHTGAGGGGGGNTADR